MGNRAGDVVTTQSQAAQFSSLLGWCAVIAFVCTPSYGVLAILFSIPLLWFIVLICFSAGIALATARWLVQRNQITAAAILFTATVLIASLTTTPIMPVVYPAGMIITAAGFMVVWPLIPSHWVRRLLAVMIGAGVLMGLLGTLANLTEPLPPALEGWVRLAGVGSGMIVLTLAIRQYQQRLNSTLQQLQLSNHELSEAKAGLEERVKERTAALEAALLDVNCHALEQARLREEVERQREAIRELSVPVLPVRQDTLIMPLVGALDSTRLRQIQEQALASIERVRARTLLLDITGVPVVDSQVAQGMIQVVESARLLGAQVALIGIRPEVAQTIVGLGLDLSRVRTFSNLQGALQGKGTELSLSQQTVFG